MIQISPSLSIIQPVSYSGQGEKKKKTGLIALGRVKMEVWWYNGQVKLAPVVLLVEKA